MTDVHGSCDARFEPVRRAFASNFDELGDVGAAVAVHLDGSCVVDLWAGMADPAHDRRWERDTPVLVFSTTKGITAICALLLWQRGELDIDAPVADAWPEFAAAGKQAVTTRHLLTHQAGLPVFEDPITVEECHDAGVVAARLAAQAPRWEPGTAHGYHMITYGWLVGEVVRRATGRTLGQVLRDELAQPLALDTWLGLPEDIEPRVAVLQPFDLTRVDINAVLADPRLSVVLNGVLDQSSLTFKALTNPLILDIEPFNSRPLHAAEWGAAGGITTARSLANLYSEVACGRVLDAATLDDATRRHSDGPDRILLVRTAFGLGFALPSDLVQYGPGGHGFGHDGAGGSVAFGDRDTGLGFAYVMNQMGVGLGADERVDRLVRAVYGCLGEGSTS